ncbi:hypothetical protein LC612_31115 [Nostoc sp. CHAB 5834]|nr:hypothetical protein [Nostoc sp. CHAB 5834]
MAKINVGSLDLSDFDKDWFIVSSNLMERSVRANLASVVTFYIRRNIEAHKELLAYAARKHGITEDECFKRLLAGEKLPQPIEGFNEQPPQIDIQD